LANNQKEKIFSNKFIQNFLENDPQVNLKNKYKFAEIASSLAYYLKSFSNINKLLDYICLILKHIFSENIILIIPLNYEGEIWHENIKISANDEYLAIQEEINSFLNQFHFSKNFKIKEIQIFENSLKLFFKNFSTLVNFFDLNLILFSNGFRFLTPIEFFLVRLIFFVDWCISAIILPMS